MKKKLRSKGSLNVMKISRTLLLSVAFFTVNIWSHSLLAMEGAFSVNLKKLELVKEQERDGDELYISVTEFPKKGTPKTYQIPNSPSHWLSRHLDGVKDVPLWSTQLKSCTDTQVVFSLVEEDLPPWNLDDLLGSVVLHLNCVNGKMVPSWTIPNSSNTERIESMKDGFHFKGDDAGYRAYFQLENGKN